MTSSNAPTRNKKYILLNMLGSKRSLVTKFGLFMDITKDKVLTKNSAKNVMELKL